MAIHFHEGLPGAGKSYEACVFHILPTLKAGRQVVTNIRGINWEKFAELLDEPVEYVQMLLIYIEPAEQDGDVGDIERVKNEFADKTPDNAMIVWDEIQDYFPSGNYKLPLNQQKFWTEHRHRGLEIVIMGQDRDDVHKIIRSRIEDIIYFLKLQAVGRPNQYKWEQLQKQAKGKFVKIGSGVRSYDPKYFGLYSTHRNTGVKGGVYQTARSNVLKNSKLLSLGVPVVFLGAIYAVVHLYGFFTGTGGAVAKPATAVTVERPVEPVAALTNPEPPSMSSGMVTSRTVDHSDAEQSPPIDYLDNLAQKHLVRATAIIDSEKKGKELMGEVELLDSSYHVKERFSVSEIRALGWTVTRTGYGLLLEKQGVAYVARTWPIELRARVDRRTVDSLGTGASGVPRAREQALSPSADIVSVGSGNPGHLW